MSGHRICILGGTGFIGRHLAARLNELQIPARILTRNREKHRELLVLPRVQLVETNVYDYDCLKHEFADCDTVINLVGILNERGHSGGGFHKAHVGLTRKVMDASHGSGCKRLLHMSALNADSKHGASYNLRTKGIAEDYIHTFSREIKATSFRPSVVFGEDDSFLTRFATLLKFSPYFFPLACPNTRFAPVYVGDVVEQIISALDDPDTYGQRLDLCGPEIFTFKELVECIARALKLKRKIIGLPDFLSKTEAWFMEYIVPGKPFSLDNYHSLQEDSVCRNGRRLPTSFKTVAHTYLANRNSHSLYNRFRQQHRD